MANLWEIRRSRRQISGFSIANIVMSPHVACTQPVYVQCRSSRSKRMGSKVNNSDKKAFLRYVVLDRGAANPSFRNASFVRRLKGGWFSARLQQHIVMIHNE